jgi:hypothetical protein
MIRMVAANTRSWRIIAACLPLAAWAIGGCGGSDSGEGGPAEGVGGGGASNSGGAAGALGSGGSFFNDASLGSGGGSSGGSGLGGSGGSDASMGGSDAGNAVGNQCVPPDSLTISPADQVVTVTRGTAFTQAYTVTAHYANQTTADVTAESLLTPSDVSIGSFAGGGFTWSGNYGGSVSIKAKNCGVEGSTSLTLKLAATFGAGGGGDGGALDPGSAAGQFAGAQPSSNPSCNPTLVYPPDGVLLPPNTNVIEVHFLPGAPTNQLFEVSFTNAATDVRIYTACKGATAAAGMPLNGGCVFELDQTEWDYVAETNRNGDPVTVRVRGLGCDADASKAGASATRQISYAKQDVVGTLYYWASMRAVLVQGQTVNSGGVYRYDYGKRGQIAEAVLTPVKDAKGNGGNSNGLCIGCHVLDREGRKMVFDFDDNDDDDEYSDVFTDIWDIPSKTAFTTIQKGNSAAFSAGYSTWNRAASQFLLDDGYGNGGALKKGPARVPLGSFQRISSAGVLAGSARSTYNGTNLHGTTPNLSPDDSTLVFAAAPDQHGEPTGLVGYWDSGKASYPMADEWFSGAGLFVAPWDAQNNTLGQAKQLFPMAPATGATASSPNYYYPSFSPDGSLIAFNYVPSGTNFHNPLARVQLVTPGGSPAADQLFLNETDPLENGGHLTNSWARWTPFVQEYKGHKLLWITFSSTRSYGLRFKNDGKHNCYPKENPNGAVFSEFDTDPACSRTQLWMAAIDLDTGKVAAGQDVSHPAFWLPFQDMATNNHLGQWAERSFTGTCDDAGNGCQAGYCCENKGCTPCSTPVPPTPTPPSCTADANCAPGQCCAQGSCSPCAVPDGGTGLPDGGGGAPADGGGGSAGGDAAPPTGCNTCLDCKGQACVGGACGGCTTSDQCCAPLECIRGMCATPVIN